MLGLLPLTVNGSLFNFTPQPGEPARFAIVLNPAGALLPLGQISSSRPSSFARATSASTR